MTDALFLSPDDLAYFGDVVSRFVAYGIGLAFAVWAVGRVLFFVYGLVRGL